MPHARVTNKSVRANGLAANLRLKENFDRSLDLFFLLPFDFNIYVSEGLKDKLESSGVTGISFSNSITF